MNLSLQNSSDKLIAPRSLTLSLYVSGSLPTFKESRLLFLFFSPLSWQRKIIYRIKAGLLWAVNIPVTDDGIWESLRNEQGKKKHISWASEGRIRGRCCEGPSLHPLRLHVGRGIEGTISDLSLVVSSGLWGWWLELAGMSCSELERAVPSMTSSMSLPLIHQIITLIITSLITPLCFSSPSRMPR